MTKRVDGRVAIVTGAARGIGRATALRLAEEGASLAIVDVDGVGLSATAELIRSTGAEALPIEGDTTDETCAGRVIEETQARFGRIDILVNNVGGTRPGRITDLSVKDWDWVMSINLRSTFLFTRAVVPHMIERRYGRIVCLSSGARNGTVWNAYYHGASAYSAAKAGVHGFIRAMAIELADHQVTVNAVAPGPIDTEVAGPFLRQMEEQGLDYSPVRMTPLRRLGTPREVADAVLYLASDEASYVTGITLDVLGGR